MLMPPVCRPPVIPLAEDISIDPPMFPAAKLRPDVKAMLPPVLVALSPAVIVTAPPTPASLPLATMLTFPAMPELALAPDESSTEPLAPVLAAPVVSLI